MFHSVCQCYLHITLYVLVASALVLFAVFRNCSVTIGNCEIIFSVDQLVTGNEEQDIYVFIISSQASYEQYVADPGKIIIALGVKVCDVCLCMYTNLRSHNYLCLQLVGIYVVVLLSFSPFAIKAAVRLTL